MNALNQAHNKAMDLATLALIERIRGNKEHASDLFEQALDYELNAIHEFESMIDRVDEPTQPTHSVLHRSAATLALDCGDIDLAEQLANKGLTQNPPTEITQELHELLNQITPQQTLTPRSETILRDEREPFG